MGKVEVGVIIGCVFLAIIAWDIWLACDGKKGNTISERARVMGRMWPPFRLILALALGLLLGHFFWTPQDVHDVSGAPCVRADG